MASWAWQYDLEKGICKVLPAQPEPAEGTDFGKKKKKSVLGIGTWLAHSETGLHMMVRKDVSKCWRWVMELDPTKICSNDGGFVNNVQATDYKSLSALYL